jgi:hypothetical protein
MASPRRRDDDDDADNRGLRRGSGPLNGHTKWIVSVASTALVSALAFLLVQDRAEINRRLTAVEQLAISTRQTQIEVMTRMAEVQRTLDRIENRIEQHMTKGK